MLHRPGHGGAVHLDELLLELRHGRECERVYVSTLNSDPAIGSDAWYLPAGGGRARLLCFMPRRQEDAIKQFSFIATVLVFLLTVWMAIPGGRRGIRPGSRWAPRRHAARHRPALDPGLQHRLHAGHRRHQLPAGDPHLVPEHVGHGGQLADRQARQGLLHPVPALGDGHVGRLHGPGLLPLLRLLGSDAAADVLSHRRLGRAAARIRGDQVLPLHPGGQRADADRPVDALLRQRPERCSTPKQLAACHVRGQRDSGTVPLSRRRKLGQSPERNWDSPPSRPTPSTSWP